MYNRYLPAAACPESADSPTCQRNEFSKIFPGLKMSNTDLLIAVAVIWFLLADGELARTDLIIIIAVLLLLGL